MSITSIFGFKIGMTQLFDPESRKALPATAVRVGIWRVLQLKTQENDGYQAVKLGWVRPRFMAQEFQEAWLSDVAKYFAVVREVALAADANASEYTIGRSVDLGLLGLKLGSLVKVSGKSKGLGFQGVMKRHGFAGGPAAHGSNFKRVPGAVGSIRACGKVLKGKRLPGRMGFDMVTVSKLPVLRIEQELGVVIVKGALPGKKNNLLQIRI